MADSLPLVGLGAGGKRKSISWESSICSGESSIFSGEPSIVSGESFIVSWERSSTEQKFVTVGNSVMLNSSNVVHQTELDRIF
jgi:hypothetical protein